MDKGGVDFIVQKHFQTPIPIEVGMGKKDDKQIKKAINKLNADYGIVISNKTSSIEKDEDIIYISPKTFSLLWIKAERFEDLSLKIWFKT